MRVARSQFYVLDEDLNVTFSDKRAHRQEISDVKFSPDDMSLAVGSHDNTVTLWDVTGPDSLDQRGRCRGHSSYITHLDWDVDSTYLQTNCGAYELLFCESFLLFFCCVFSSVCLFFSLLCFFCVVLCCCVSMCVVVVVCCCCVCCCCVSRCVLLFFWELSSKRK